ncbi:acyl carrier protein [Paenibacillus sp. CF095]|uniref:antiterminator LoaP n=1 Tax=Paenibacillus sp. CF095 TaxID=1881033 RepID=UPI00088197F0|nr:antiterminator LoaP [Paenibacillus sp. CF095]SDD50579.1 acyl carrier protein [Paenibacillus sp. CF095]
MKWYALFVRNGEEDYVKQQIQFHLGELECNCFIPKRMVPERKNGVVNHVVKIMFPGYVFLQTKMDFSKYNKIQKIPNIISLLNYCNKKDIKFDVGVEKEEAFFKFIPDDEMKVLLELTNPENDTMEYSEFWLNQGKLTILSGPLKGMEGRIKKIDKRKQRAKLAINIMGQENLVDIGFEAVDPICIDLLNQGQYLWRWIRQKVEHIIRELIQAPKDAFINNVFKFNGINSIVFIRLIYNLETEFGIKVSENEFSLDKLKTIDDVVFYIQNRINVI